MRRLRRTESGFTLVELLLSLVVVGLALALAAQVLMETAQMLGDAAAEQVETALPLARARLRADIEAAASAEAFPGADGTLGELRLSGHPAGVVRWRKVGRELRRDIWSGGAAWEGETVAMRGVKSWLVLSARPDLVALEIHLLRRSLHRTPLAVLPAVRGPADEERVETLAVAPRGAGLGDGW